MSADISKLNVRGFQCHQLSVILSVQKQPIMSLDTESSQNPQRICDWDHKVANTAHFGKLVDLCGFPCIETIISPYTEEIISVCSFVFPNIK